MTVEDGEVDAELLNRSEFRRLQDEGCASHASSGSSMTYRSCHKPKEMVMRKAYKTHTHTHTH